MNCGCPTRDELRRGLGAALLRKPAKLARLVRWGSGASIGAGADLTELQGCAMWLLLTLVLGSPMHHARAQRALGAHSERWSHDALSGGVDFSDVYLWFYHLLEGSNAFLATAIAVSYTHLTLPTKA